MQVAAVLVTFASPDTLRTCIAACLAQTRRPDVIVVIDNAGTPRASATLASSETDDSVRVVRAEQNLGPAGGFARGLALARDEGYDLVWTMDDDVVPEPACLERLIERQEMEGQPTIVFPQEIDGRDGSTLNYPAWAGVLIPRDVIVRVGLPRSEFFWWMEDTEYLYYRMRDHGIPSVRDEVARVNHQRARRGGATPAWKLYYETRNSTYMRLYVIKRGYKAWVKRIIRRLGYVLLRSPNRIRDLVAYVRGLVDGIFRRLGLRYPVP